MKRTLPMNLPFHLVGTHSTASLIVSPKHGDAVERVPTGFKGARRVLVRGVLTLTAILALLAVGAAAPLSLLAQELNATAAALKAQAYRLHEMGKYAESAAAFKAYLDEGTEDLRAALDYAGLLSQLKQHERAAQWFAYVCRKDPRNESAKFKLGVEYVTLQQYPAAETMFKQLLKSDNKDMATAATEALQRLQEALARETRYQSESRVFELAQQGKHPEVVRAVDDLEKAGAVAFPLAMQRLYSLQSLGQYTPALDKANQLAAQHPTSSDLMLLRASLLGQLGHHQQAEALLRQVARDFVGSPGAIEARSLLGEDAGNPSANLAFAMARSGKHAEVIEAINAMEQNGPISLTLAMQRLFSLQALNRIPEALQRAEALAAAHPKYIDLALLRSDLLVRAQRWEDASVILKKIKHDNPNSPFEVEALNRLRAIPPIANLDKTSWGEAWNSGDYHGRFGTLIGSGFAREGFFTPGARWLQPYGEFRYGVDTKSGAAQQSTIVTDNHLSLYGGVRVQPLKLEYLFLYVQAGVDWDLLDRRNNGSSMFDYQGGAYGFKSWGPGVVLLSDRPGKAAVRTTGGVPVAGVELQPREIGEARRKDLFWWRGDWFVDAGADFSYYHRYSSWIGYGQAHEGFRLFQVGPQVGFDAYAVENVAWDVRGNFYDNLVEIGPGARLLWMPRRGWEVVLRAEYLFGFYFGRDSLGTRGLTPGQYENFHAGLSVGVIW